MIQYVHMDTLIFLYGIIILVLIIGAFFIVYHILRYSLSDTLGYFGAGLFGAVFVFLLAFNFISFQALNTDQLVPTLEIAPLMDSGIPAIAPTKNNPW